MNAPPRESVVVGPNHGPMSGLIIGIYHFLDVQKEAVPVDLRQTLCSVPLFCSDSISFIQIQGHKGVARTM